VDHARNVILVDATARILVKTVDATALVNQEEVADANTKH